MRKVFVIIAMLLLLAVAVQASNTSLCSDTDGGGKGSKDAALKNKGEVKYGITTQVDTCLTSEDGVSTNSSKYLKEYFCDNDQRRSEVYDCVKLGFTGCVSGECKGSSSGASNQTQQTQPEKTCGNKILEKAKGEECDPPNAICFGKTTEQYGICGADCKCKISSSAPKPVAKCGDGDRDTSEECEEDKDCPTNYLCSSCKCVKQLTPEEIEAMKNKPKEEPKTETETKEEPKTAEVDLTVKNFSEDPGIKATSSIAGFFKSIFGWLGKIFS